MVLLESPEDANLCPKSSNKSCGKGSKVYLSREFFSLLNIVRETRALNPEQGEIRNYRLFPLPLF